LLRQGTWRSSAKLLPWGIAQAWLNPGLMFCTDVGNAYFFIPEVFFIRRKFHSHLWCPPAQLLPSLRSQKGEWPCQPFTLLLLLSWEPCALGSAYSLSTPYWKPRLLDKVPNSWVEYNEVSEYKLDYPISA
jgi:hypothetical protein